MERMILIICLLCALATFRPCIAQDSSHLRIPPKVNLLKPEILSSGFIDVITNGQVNASARLIRIFLGEPGKLAIPLSIYSGVSSGNFSGQQNLGVRSNEQLINGFINPLSGLVNFSFEGKFCLSKKKQLTSAGFLYQSGFRVMTGYKVGQPGDPLTGRPINFFNSYGSGGIYFQTGAWEKNDSGNMGIFWLTVRYIGCYSTPKSLREVIPGITSGLYYGWSIGGGVEINNLVNVKIIYYKYRREPELGFILPLCQFSFHYALRQ